MLLLKLNILTGLVFWLNNFFLILKSIFEADKLNLFKLLVKVVKKEVVFI